MGDKEYLFEFIALVLVIMSIAMIALPLFTDVLKAEEKQKTIIIRAYVKEAGGFQPEVIHVKKGDRVKLIVEGMDVTHGFAIEGLGIDLGSIEVGKKKTIEFVADKEGVYVFKCTLMCSPMHNFMKGKIIVEEE
jgi:heme/copper-type cytochrome/quinol oxidase subunit 2